ncbi:hypothetical protein LJC14_06590 [Treponema sp. OttesenSCG-928-L16]|nr:hypothetical protein [Treponema sp. OttesenSCG-928-L16]
MNTGKMSPAARDAGFLCIWIIGILGIGSLLLLLVQSPGANGFIRSVNKTLEMYDLPYRLDAPVSTWGLVGNEMQNGNMYTLRASDDIAMIVPIAAGGIDIVCLALIGGDGNMKELIPLSNNSMRNLGRLPEGIVETYLKYLESGPVPPGIWGVRP